MLTCINFSCLGGLCGHWTHAHFFHGGYREQRGGIRMDHQRVPWRSDWFPTSLLGHHQSLMETNKNRRRTKGRSKRWHISTIHGKHYTTLLITNISHLWKRKIIFPATFKGDMSVPWRVPHTISFCWPDFSRFVNALTVKLGTLLYFCWYIFLTRPLRVLATCEWSRKHQEKEGEPQGNACFFGVCCQFQAGYTPPKKKAWW